LVTVYVLALKRNQFATHRSEFAEAGQTGKCGVKNKRLKVGWDESRLLKVLGGQKRLP